MEGGVEKVARPVPGEHASGAVGAVRGRREAHDHEPCGRIPEARHRTGPVLRFTKSRRRRRPDLRAVRAQVGAARTRDDATLERLERNLHGRGYWATLHGAPEPSLDRSPATGRRDNAPSPASCARARSTVTACLVGPTQPD